MGKLLVLLILPSSVFVRSLIRITFNELTLKHFLFRGESSTQLPIGDLLGWVP